MMYIDHIYTTCHILVPRSWRWMNASSLLLPDGSMDVVIEKGTLDSLQDVAFGEFWDNKTRGNVDLTARTWGFQRKSVDST